MRRTFLIASASVVGVLFALVIWQPVTVPA